MNIKIVGKDLKVTEAIEEYVTRKMERIEKYFDGDGDVQVTIKTERNEQIAEMHVSVKGATYRAVTAHKDMYASIDKDIDILEGQIRKFKTKRERQTKEESIRQMNTQSAQSEEAKIENEIIKTLYYEIKPMTPEDAVLKLQEKPENRFMPFVNIENGKVNVIYRLKDNSNYGLIEPEA